MKENKRLEYKQEINDKFLKTVSAFANYDPADVIYDMHHSFSALWNTSYKGSISIKNSMRDTFAAGLRNIAQKERVVMYKYPKYMFTC